MSINFMFSNLNPLRWIKYIVENDLLLPVILLLVYLLFLALVKGTIPTSDEIIATFANLYQKYGYEIIFVSAFIESLIMVNLIVPGGAGLLLGVIFARTGQTELIPVILVACVGTVLGYILDYLLGYFGFADFLKKFGGKSLFSESKDKLKRFGKRTLILAFIHANIGSFVSFAAGAARFNFKVFLIIAVAATLFWATLWAMAVYAIGDIFIILFRKYSFLILVLVITGGVLNSLWKGRRESSR